MLTCKYKQEHMMAASICCPISMLLMRWLWKMAQLMAFTKRNTLWQQ